MSKHEGNAKSPIRRISKDEELKRPEQRRAWPDKKHKASELDIPMPRPGDKNRIHSVLVALPVLMLVIALFVYFRGESAQNNGEPVLSELVSREGLFKSVTVVSGIGTPKHFLWYTNGDQTRGVRITPEHREKIIGLPEGVAINLDLVPHVAGSTTLWVYKLAHDGDEIIGVGRASE